ncbi:hypothetical protein [Streptomyces sp. H27-C3]|uniref:hypothetical protein n=1 Tax=Streptomyces sp. H27-C3 TaxID=3046305 RepID=UPI0024B8A33F|nr:hypothetical protein [Streptomyces sp. H27-C3]MDJ0463658.1 hypothetical protein [Streptomyces sp. H27-C3]
MKICARTYRGLVTGALVGGLMLTGCTGTDGGAARSERGGGSRADDGKGRSGGTDGQYAPGPSHPSAAPGTRSGRRAA